MTNLSDLIEVSPRFARSANVERDTTHAEPLAGYLVTARALDVVERVATIAATTTAGGAWSITGPYGSGKSSLAVLLDGAFGQAGPIRDRALELIGAVSPTVVQTVLDAHANHDTVENGFIRAVVTANREPISYTVLRALHSAVLRRYGKIPPASRFSASKTLKSLLADAASSDPRRVGPSPASLLEVARGLATEAPLLLLVDEFGKNLEAVADSGDADPYLLQQLAEAGQGNGVPIFILTLQHLSFEDYFTGTSEAQQREWAKVQGRFEDIPYSESPSQTRTLIGTVFAIRDEELGRSVVAWSNEQAKTMAALGATDLADPEVVASCYPLDPLAAAVLPELCSRFGQNERTLFSFLTGADPAGAVAFLLEASWQDATDSPPAVGLAQIYDYFVESGTVSIMSGAQASRWTEVTTRLRDTHGLTAAQEAVAKSIAVLNLVSVTGILRASVQVLEMVAEGSEAILAELEAMGLVTYREFADEYRIWQGSDIDLRRLLDIALLRGQRQKLVEIVDSLDEPTPVVAARHSAQNDILRVFSRRYVHGGEVVDPLSPFSEVDGEVLLVLGTDGVPPLLATVDGPTKPTVVATPDDIEPFETAARSVAAIQSVIDDPVVSEDWVARRELSERLAQAQVALDAARQEAFASDNCRWTLLTSSGSVQLEGGRGSAALSDAADRAYPSTPIVGNEMLNRSDVTSQGSKARRLLLEAMLEHAEEPDLGLSGYGPEVAMYRSFLKAPGLHRTFSKPGQWTFVRPTGASQNDDYSLAEAWALLDAQFKRAQTQRVNLNDIYAVLMSPPVGMKAAVVPVFVTVALIVLSDEVAIYEHGTFKPILSPDISERMVRNPGHFDVKHFASSTGGRRELLEQLAESLGVASKFRKHRVSNVLAIVGYLVALVSRLDNYTLHTDNLSPSTRAVRDALATAVEPDELLFEALPQALGFPKVGSRSRSYESAGALAKAVKEAVVELEGSYEILLETLLQDLLDECAESRRVVMAEADSLSDEVVDPEIRAFVLALGNDSAELDNSWIQTIATVVSKKAPAEWADDDRSRFGRLMPIATSAYKRLLALHIEQRAEAGGSFDAMRVTFTRTDGREQFCLVALDETERDAAEETLLVALDALTELTGSQVKAQQALLSLLGERLMPTVENVEDVKVVDLRSKKVANG